MQGLQGDVDSRCMMQAALQFARHLRAWPLATGETSCGMIKLPARGGVLPSFHGIEEILCPFYVFLAALERVWLLHGVGKCTLQRCQLFSACIGAGLLL